MRPRAEQPVVALILRDLAFGPSTVVELETVLQDSPTESAALSLHAPRHAQDLHLRLGTTDRTSAACGRVRPQERRLRPLPKSLMRSYQMKYFLLWRKSDNRMMITDHVRKG